MQLSLNNEIVFFPNISINNELSPTLKVIKKNPMLVIIAFLSKFFLEDAKFPLKLVSRSFRYN